MPAPADRDPLKFSRTAELLGNALVLLATGIFFFYLTWVCYGHTPPVSEPWKWGLAAFTSATITGIFWIAAQGFRVALTEHLRVKKHGPV